MRKREKKRGEEENATAFQYTTREGSDTQLGESREQKSPGVNKFSKIQVSLRFVYIYRDGKVSRMSTLLLRGARGISQFPRESYIPAKL